MTVSFRGACGARTERDVNYATCGIDQSVSHISTLLLPVDSAGGQARTHWPEPQAQGILRGVVIELDEQTPLEAAETLLGEALAQSNTLHLSGARALLRERLACVLALTAVDRIPGLDAAQLAQLHSLRVHAQSAWAQDARHGARALSRSAQRAPTRRDCDEGWENVGRIVSGAEVAAAEAVRLASLTDEPSVQNAADLAEAAAKEARGIVENRNHAYTFHADPSFSFGEGWYVAAAALLTDIEIQIEPDQVQSDAAERFLSDAGLGARLVPYRSRPRANKALPAIIADAFGRDAPAAQRCLRRAFLGEAPLPEVAEWLDEAFREASPAAGKVLIWVRKAVHDAERNTAEREHATICRLAAEQGLVPIVFGDALDQVPAGAVDLTLCWKEPLFQGVNMRRAQLWLFEGLARDHGLVGQVGVTSAGMDGPALMGLPTMYLTEEPNVRLGRWVGAIPGYEEIVRSEGSFDRIGARFADWAGGAGRAD
ncbi:MAG: hypothetical protein AB8G23_05410 [Myxococcota bacterium]